MGNSWGIEAIASLAKVVQDDPEADYIASHLALNTLESLDCRAVAIGAIQKDGFLDLIGNYGLSEKTTSPYLRMPLWTELPMSEAARTGEFIFIRTYDEFVARYPDMVESIQYKEAVTISAPIKHRNVTIGSVAFASIKAPAEDFKDNPITEAALALLSLYIKNFLTKKSSNSKATPIQIKSLTPRQKQIIKLFKDQLTTDQMADRLRFSPSTIKQDIIRIYELFGVHTREEVVTLAERAGLLN